MPANAVERVYQKRQAPWMADMEQELRRHKFTWRVIPKNSYGRILEIACAEGHFTERLRQLGGELYALDVSATAAGRARQRLGAGINFVAGDIRSLPFKDGSFDLIVCLEVLQYVERPQRPAVLRGLHDMLSADGTLVLSGPLIGGQRWEFDGVLAQYFGRNEFTDLISSQFRIRRVASVAPRYTLSCLITPFQRRIYDGVVIRKVKSWLISGSMALSRLFPRALAFQVAVVAGKKRN